MNSLYNDQNPPPQKPRNFFMGALKAIFATIGALTTVFFIVFILLICLAFYAVSNGAKSFSSTFNSSSGSNLAFTVPHTNGTYIAGIRLEGEITSESASSVLEKLDTARDDKHVIGILFDVNSPGGSVVPSQEIYDKIKEIIKVKPVVTYVRDMAASGAYYSSASSDKIIANRGSIIGSIGVIMNGFEADKLIQFLKINPVVIKTGALKDTGSPTRSMTENDKKYLQSLIEETRAQFVSDVQKARKTTDSAMNFMSDGRVVLGPQALKLKLIDSIGTKQNAIEQVAHLAKQIDIPSVYYYEDIQNFSDLFAKRLSESSTSILRESLLEFFKPQKVTVKYQK